MRRCPFGILSFFPLGVCLLLCWVSVRGGFLGPHEGFARHVVDPAARRYIHYGLRTAENGLEISFARVAYVDDQAYQRGVVMNGITTQTRAGSELAPHFKEGTHPRLERTGFAVGQFQGRGRYGTHYDWAVRVPYWTIAALKLVPHGFVVTRGLRALRSLDWNRAGRCADCGYDLRASGERCPECGSDRVEATTAPLALNSSGARG
jgi:hypothetical protein